jgi:extracellular factor (EF) 3-hydroxypalmitic acid methyl ester biosynthesis protein
MNAYNKYDRDMLQDTSWNPPIALNTASFSQREASTILLDAIGQGNLSSIPDECNGLLHGLNLIRRLCTTYSWQAEVEFIREHPAFEHLLRSPINWRCVYKPRGYAGDAVTIDLLYGIETVDGTDPVAHAVHDWLRTQAGSRSVNLRREAIAATVTNLGLRKPGASVLSVACGHAREVELIDARALANLKRFVCLDQDAESLATARRDYPNARLETIEGSVLAILRGKIEFDTQFDLIYTAGLYDYLEERVARALTARLTDMLAPGGRLLIANFTTNLPDIAYMEAFMDWKLIYRNEADMRNLAPKLNANDSIKTPRLASQNFVWLDLLRAD